MTPRERIARIVDPLAFEDDTGASIGARDVAREFREAAINKADRILAAFPEIAGEMGYVKFDDTPKQDKARALGLTEE